jgi:hypothetical protein
MSPISCGLFYEAHTWRRISSFKWAARERTKLVSRAEWFTKQQYEPSEATGSGSCSLTTRAHDLEMQFVIKVAPRERTKLVKRAEWFMWEQHEPERSDRFGLFYLGDQRVRARATLALRSCYCFVISSQLASAPAGNHLQ